MITCLHVLEDPNKSTLLIYSANPLTLYFVNILKGVTETIYIDRNEHSIKAPKSDDGITEAEDVDFVQIYEHAKYSHSVSNKEHQVIKVIVVIG